MLSITECDAITNLFAEDEDFVLLKIKKYNTVDESFYLAFVKYCFNDFRILLKKNNDDYTVLKIYCDRSFIVSCENKIFHAPSPIVISKPTTSFELETITNFAFSIEDVRLICQKMLNATFSFSEKDSFRKIASYEKDIF